MSDELIIRVGFEEVSEDDIARMVPLVGSSDFNEIEDEGTYECNIGQAKCEIIVNPTDFAEFGHSIVTFVIPTFYFREGEFEEIETGEKQKILPAHNLETLSEFLEQLVQNFNPKYILGDNGYVLDEKKPMVPNHENIYWMNIYPKENTPERIKDLEGDRFWISGEKHGYHWIVVSKDPSSDKQTEKIINRARQEDG